MATQASLLSSYLNTRFNGAPKTGDITKDPYYQNFVKQQKVSYWNNQASQADAAQQAAKNQNFLMQAKQYGLPALGTAVKQVGTGVVNSVKVPAQVVSTGIARALPGGTADLQAAAQQQNQQSAFTTQIAQKVRDPNLTTTQRAHYKILLNNLTQNKQPADALTNTLSQISNDTNKKAFLASIAALGSFAIPVGGAAEAFRAGAAPALGAVAKGVTAGAIGGGAGTIAQNPNAALSDVLKQAGVGAALGGGLVAAGGAIGKLRAGKGVVPPVEPGVTPEVPPTTPPLELNPTLQPTDSTVPAYLRKQEKVAHEAAVNPTTPLDTPTFQHQQDIQAIIKQGNDELTNFVNENPNHTPQELDAAKESINQQVQQQVDKLRQARQAEVNPTQSQITPEMAGQLQESVPTSVQQFQELNPKVSAGTATPEEVAQHATAVSQLQTAAIHAQQSAAVQQSILDPTVSMSGVTGQIAKSQSVLRDSLVQQYPHLDNIIPKFTHEVHGQAQLEAQAKQLVDADPQAAQQLYLSGSLNHLNMDAANKLGEELSYRAAQQGDTKTLNRLMSEYVPAGTSQGQALRSRQLGNILSPRNITIYAARLADQNGKPLTASLAAEIQRAASIIDKMPEGADKIQAQIALKDKAEQISNLRKVGRAGNQAAASIRAILASTDLSAGGRQGGVLFARFPDIGIKAEALGAKAAFSTDFYNQEVQKLANLTDESGVPLSQAFDRMKLSLQPLKGASEEQFQNASLAEKTPGLGGVLKGSERAYNLTLSYMRAQAAKRMIDAAGGVEAVNANWNTKNFLAMGRVIDTISGRGRGGTPINDISTFEKIAPALSQGLFSARLWKSRLDLLNPLFYAQVANNPQALRLAIRSGTQFAGAVGTVLGLASALGATVITDPRSSN